MTDSYWQRIAGWTDRWVETPIPGEVDFAIIGAGFAGLTTAIRLREQHPDATIVILESERVGYGASGRNAGFLSPLAAPIWLLAPEHAWGAQTINAEVHAIARWIREHLSDCEIAPAKLALQAQSRLSDAALGEFIAAVARVGLSHRVVESRVWPGHAVLEMDAYTLHPYKLVRALAERSDQLGIRIRERARVKRVEALRGGGARVDELFEAGKVVVCTNAYTSSLDVGERVSAIAMQSSMIATAPVDMVRDGDFTVEVGARQAYHRMHDGRLIYGADFLPKTMPGVAIEHAWGGRFHVTPTGLPIIRMAAENHAIVFNVGYGGTGVALSLVCAKLAAAVASHGRFTNVDDTRLLALIHSTRLSVRNSVRALARIARAAAMPWA